MSNHSNIGWTDATWNFLAGCEKVSPGCDNCYALALTDRLQATGINADLYNGTTVKNPTAWTGRVNPAYDRMKQPDHWQTPRRIFVNSLADTFHDDVSTILLDTMMCAIERNPGHTFQVLTKRPHNARRYLQHWPTRAGRPLPSNLWVGVSIETSQQACAATILREIPATIRFISAEPLLGPLDDLDLTGIQWLIVGGESGARHRPIEPEWVQKLHEQAIIVGTAFFFKQWGGRTPHAGGRQLDGTTYDEYPDQPASTR